MCRSVLRTYTKETKQTTCNQCGKQRPKPRLDIENLKFEAPDLSNLEKTEKTEIRRTNYSHNKNNFVD
jgi:hypothetical protein